MFQLIGIIGGQICFQAESFIAPTNAQHIYIKTLKLCISWSNKRFSESKCVVQQ